MLVLPARGAAGKRGEWRAIAQFPSRRRRSAAAGAAARLEPVPARRPALLRGQEPRLLDPAVGRLGGLFLPPHAVGHRQRFRLRSYVIHTALLTATGYSITLLMAVGLPAADPDAAGLSPGSASIVIVAVAAAAFSAIETWSIATFVQPGDPARGAALPRRDPAHRVAARRLVGALLQHQLTIILLEEQTRPAAPAREPGLERAARHAALPAQPAFPVQHAELDLDPGAAEADRPRQCDAVAAVLLPALHSGQRTDRPWSRSRRRSRR